MRQRRTTTKTTAKTNAKRKTTIYSALKRVWFYYDHERKEVLNRCRMRVGLYRCEECQDVVTKLQVHHVLPVATTGTLSDYCNTLFVGADYLKGLCHNCHKETHKKLRRKGKNITQEVKQYEI